MGIVLNYLACFDSHKFILVIEFVYCCYCRYTCCTQNLHQRFYFTQQKTRGRLQLHQDIHYGSTEISRNSKFYRK